MDLSDGPDGFLDWAEVAATLAHECWVAVTAERPGRPPVTVVTAHQGRLGISDKQLSPSERAELCRWGFVPMTTPGGRCWCWAPPSSRRPHRRGAAQILRSGEIAWSCALQRDRKVLRVLRDLLHAAPADLTLHLEQDEQELAG